MSRLVALFSGAVQALDVALTPLGLVVDPQRHAGLGIAHAEEGSVMLSSRPASRSAEPVSIHLGHAQTRAALIRVIGLEARAVAPLRFGPWMWSWLGELPSDAVGLAERIAALPGSLRRNIAQPTASAVLFHEILAGLSRRGIKKTFWAPPPEQLCEAIGEALTRWRARFGRPMGAFALMNGERAHLGHAGRALYRRPTDPALWIYDSENCVGATPLEAGQMLVLDGHTELRLGL